MFRVDCGWVRVRTPSPEVPNIDGGLRPSVEQFNQPDMRKRGGSEFYIIFYNFNFCL